MQFMDNFLQIEECEFTRELLSEGTLHFIHFPLFGSSIKILNSNFCGVPLDKIDLPFFDEITKDGKQFLLLYNFGKPNLVPLNDVAACVVNIRFDCIYQIYKSGNVYIKEKEKVRGLSINEVRLFLTDLAIYKQYESFEIEGGIDISSC